SKLPRQDIAEVSRLAVIAAFRRRKGEANSAVGVSGGDFGTSDQPRFPFIPIGLYLATTELARLNGIDTVFVLTEKRLASHFSKLGFDLQYIGNPIEHNGERIPSMMSVSATINNMRINLHPLYHAIAADIKRNLPQEVSCFGKTNNQKLAETYHSCISKEQSELNHQNQMGDV
ncbi:MAG: PEP-CTERM/exosortase system-associated acyltransferase, partial [Nitrosospira sp.]